MKIWQCEIVEKETDKYLALKADGWEPHQFTLIPVPKEVAGLILQPNGDAVGAQFVQIVMMRKQFEVANPTGVRAFETDAPPFDTDAEAANG